MNARPASQRNAPAFGMDAEARFVLTLLGNKADVKAHANCLAVADQSTHVDVLRPAFCTAQLGRTGADLLGQLGLGEPLPLSLVGKLKADAQDLAFFSKPWRTAGLASCWSRYLSHAFFTCAYSPLSAFAARAPIRFLPQASPRAGPALFLQEVRLRLVSIGQLDSESGAHRRTARPLSRFETAQDYWIAQVWLARWAIGFSVHRIMPVPLTVLLLVSSTTSPVSLFWIE